MNLRELLEEYKSLTIQITQKAENIDEIPSLVDKRGRIINEIEKLKFSKEEIKLIVDELDIVSLDNKMREVLLNEKKNVKEQMVSLRKNRNAQQGYTGFKSYPYFFNREG